MAAIVRRIAPDVPAPNVRLAHALAAAGLAPGVKEAYPGALAVFVGRGNARTRRRWQLSAQAKRLTQVQFLAIEGHEAAHAGSTGRSAIAAQDIGHLVVLYRIHHGIFRVLIIGTDDVGDKLTTPGVGHGVQVRRIWRHGPSATDDTSHKPGATGSPIGNGENFALRYLQALSFVQQGKYCC